MPPINSTAIRTAPHSADCALINTGSSANWPTIMLSSNGAPNGNVWYQTSGNKR
jgi:hypothetical protein